MPGWQITSIAVTAALLAAVLAVFLERARAARPGPCGRPPPPHGPGRALPFAGVRVNATLLIAAGH